MPDAAAWLPDTNILLRMSKIDDPQYPTINGAVRALVARGARFSRVDELELNDTIFTHGERLYLPHHQFAAKPRCGTQMTVTLSQQESLFNLCRMLRGPFKRYRQRRHLGPISARR